jgi:4-amino-4-deoxy-L-arabinose transferase-like glycosyltransferase
VAEAAVSSRVLDAGAAGWRALLSERLLVYGVLAGLTLGGLLLRLQRAWEDMPELVVKSVPDDSFYYFQIARNIMHGQGATLDGENVTSGFHPLWLFITLPVFAVDDRQLSVHLALTIGALLGAGTIVVIFAIVRALTGNGLASLVAAGFLALHPKLAVDAVNGIETSLMMFLLALTCLLFVRAARSEEPLGLRTYGALGASGGLLILSRTDTALVLPAMLAWLVWRERGQMRWRGPALSLATAGALVLPWLIWCFFATGSVMQDSAVAGGVLARERYFAANGDSFGAHVDYGIDSTKTVFRHLLPHDFMVPLFDPTWPFWVAVMIVAAAVVVIPASRRGETLRHMALLGMPFGAMLLMLLYESAVRGFVRSWYIAPYAILTAAAMGLVANWLEGAAVDGRDWLWRVASKRPGQKSLRPIPAFLVVGAVYVVVSLILLRQYGPQRDDVLVYGYPWQRDVLAATEWIEQNTPPDARIAAYNAGIPAYLSGRTVVNLDGVVNRDAYEAARDCTTLSYIREQQIDYIADSAGQFFFASCSIDFERDMELVTSFGRDPNKLFIAVPRSDANQ